jgi:hypothetical protein
MKTVMESLVFFIFFFLLCALYAPTADNEKPSDGGTIYDVETFGLTMVSQQYDMQKTREDEDKITYEYMFCARENNTFLTCGKNPTVKANAGGFSIMVKEGSCMGPLLMTIDKTCKTWRPGDKLRCAYTAKSNKGTIEFIHLSRVMESRF